MPRGVYERRIVPPHQRFWAKVDKTGDCWIWTAAKNGKYGAFGIGRGDIRPAHRYAYEISVGPIPEGLTIDHLCRNTLCVNPDHLEAVTLRENILRGESPTIVIYRTGKCGRGHERTSENTYITPAGKRQCITCRNILRSAEGYKERQAANRKARRARVAEAGR